MNFFTRRPRCYVTPLSEPLTLDQAGAIARNLTDRHMFDTETVSQVYQLLDTIALLQLKRESPQFATLKTSPSH